VGRIHYFHSDSERKSVSFSNDPKWATNSDMQLREICFDLLGSNFTVLFRIEETAVTFIGGAWSFRSRFTSKSNVWILNRYLMSSHDVANVSVTRMYERGLGTYSIRALSRLLAVVDAYSFYPPLF
jgi:hypothetical protein